MRIRDWSSDVCSSDLLGGVVAASRGPHPLVEDHAPAPGIRRGITDRRRHRKARQQRQRPGFQRQLRLVKGDRLFAREIAAPVVEDEGIAAAHQLRSEEHTSELQSLMRISYAVFCLK